MPLRLPSPPLRLAAEGSNRMTTLLPEMLPILRRRAQRPRVLLAAIFRCDGVHCVGLLRPFGTSTAGWGRRLLLFVCFYVRTTQTCSIYLRVVLAGLRYVCGVSYSIVLFFFCRTAERKRKVFHRETGSSVCWKRLSNCVAFVESKVLCSLLKYPRFRNNNRPHEFSPPRLSFVVFVPYVFAIANCG